jgi:hypothetical protein
MSNVGADPEFFAITKTGAVRSAHKFPEVFAKPKDCWVQRWHRDGVAIEFNSPASSCRDTVVPFTAMDMQTVQTSLEKEGLTLGSAPVGKVLKADLVKAPLDVRKGGCQPDVNGYTAVPKSPEAYVDQRRFTGGHLHKGMHIPPVITVGYGKIKEDWLSSQEALEKGSEIARKLDIYIGLPLVAALGKTFALGEADRREFYGQAGSFRWQPHGFEYRVPSGRIMVSPIMFHAFLGIIKEFLPQWPVPKELDKDTVQGVINYHDWPVAQRIWKEVLFPFFVPQAISKASLKPAAYGNIKADWFTINTIIKGDEEGIHFRDSVKWNWCLYPNFPIKDHKYIGNLNANIGGLDALIYPQRILLDKKYIHFETPKIIHPSVANDKSYDNLKSAQFNAFWGFEY